MTTPDMTAANAPAPVPIAGAMDLYVYYRAHYDHAARLKAGITAMQAQLQSACGVDAALKRRPRAAGPVTPVDPFDTWMEIYPAIPAGFETILQDMLARDPGGCAALIDGIRHMEYFEDCAACA